MSKEIDDLGAALQPDSQPAAPIAPSGGASGPQAPPEPGAPEPRLAAPAPDVAQPGGSVPAPAPLAPPPAPEAAVAQAALLGEPDTLPPTWCKKCSATVTPQGKGRCPRCQTFLRLNFYPRKHPVNKLRVDTLLADLLAQFPPINIIERSNCEQLAATMEQLEATKPGSTEWLRLVTAKQTLDAAVHDAHAAHVARTPTVLSDLTEDQLIARAEKLLATAKGARDLRRKPPVAPAPSEDTSIVPEPGDSGYVEEIAPATTPAEPTCGYGCGSLTRCAELKTTRPDAWAALHYSDPEEVKKRDEHATKVMLKMMPYGNPY